MANRSVGRDPQAPPFNQPPSHDIMGPMGPCMFPTKTPWEPMGIACGRAPFSGRPGGQSMGKSMGKCWENDGET